MSADANLKFAAHIAVSVGAAHIAVSVGAAHIAVSVGAAAGHTALECALLL